MSKTPKSNPDAVTPEEVAGVTEVLRISEYGVSAEAIRCILNRRDDPRIQKILEWMRGLGLVISRLARVNKIEIWELNTPEAVKRAEERFR